MSSKPASRCGVELSEASSSQDEVGHASLSQLPSCPKCFTDLELIVFPWEFFICSDELQYIRGFYRCVIVLGACQVRIVVVGMSDGSFTRSWFGIVSKRYRHPQQPSSMSP